MGPKLWSHYVLKFYGAIANKNSPKLGPNEGGGTSEKKSIFCDFFSIRKRLVCPQKKYPNGEREGLGQV